MKHIPHLFAAILAVAAPAFAQNKDQLPERSEADILKTVKLPDGYEATVFAPAPKGGYPVQVSSAIDGTIFVAVDENGSLGRDRNPATGVEGPKDGRIPGRIVRMRDTNGDGRADEFKTFCDVESPRGVIWDGPGMGADGKMPGKLYVMHPPNLTVYTDTDGDGKSDRQEDILTGLGFDLGFRGADHTTNGCALGIDGFIYVAVGDYGFTKAVAKDGTTLSNRGGGIVRIRPDGTGFEIVSRGQRNILDVAISPTMDLFTRDNTNDGGNWNVRLSFVPPGAHMGYPYLFKNFSEDTFDALADLGGGSPCGSIWLDEPGLPKGLFTVEWGAGGIFYHDDLAPNGAGYKLKSAETDSKDPVWKRPATKQTKWLGLTRPTDMDVDASGCLYITSWEGATFNYNGPYAGYVLRVVKKDAPKVEVPDLQKADPALLSKLIVSGSAVVRQAAQRELLRRKVDANDFAPMNTAHSLADKGDEGAAYASMFFFVQNGRGEMKDVGLPVQADWPAATRLLYLRAIGDGTMDIGLHSVTSLVNGLRDQEPKIRAASVTGLRRLGRSDASPSILPLVADSDPVVSHLAVRALSELKAIEPCLSALDSADASVQPGALRALYGIYSPQVVDGLIARLQSSPGGTGGSPVVAGGSPATPSANGAAPTSDIQFTLRRGILNALCRLANQDAPYESPSVWWGTRPDTSGPVYQPIPWSETDKVTAALKTALEKSNEDDGKWLVARMYATKVSYPGLVELMLAKAGNDTAAKLTAIEGMIRADNSLPEEGVTALQAIAMNEKEAPELRVRALRVFQRCSENGKVFPGAMNAFAPLAGHDIADAKLKGVFEDFTRGSANGKWVGDYSKALGGTDVQKRFLAATVLVNLSTGKVGKEGDRKNAAKSVEDGFKKPESAAALLTAIARTGAKPLADKVKAHLNDPNNAVAESALFAYQKLGLKDEAKPSKTIGELKYEEVFALVQKGGDAKAGQDLYLRAGCIACHTVNADEPPKGPILSAVAKIYDRAALTESLLKPNAKLAQGFESAFFKTKKGDQIEGFVTREGGDSVDVRNIAGQTVTIEKGDIVERGHRPQSMMPEGLLNAFTPTELANLLAWLESLKK